MVAFAALAFVLSYTFASISALLAAFTCSKIYSYAQPLETPPCTYNIDQQFMVNYSTLYFWLNGLDGVLLCNSSLCEAEMYCYLISSHFIYLKNQTNNKGQIRTTTKEKYVLLVQF